MKLWQDASKKRSTEVLAVVMYRPTVCAMQMVYIKLVKERITKEADRHTVVHPAILLVQPHQLKMVPGHRHQLK